MYDHKFKLLNFYGSSKKLLKNLQYLQSFSASDGETMLNSNSESDSNNVKDEKEITDPKPGENVSSHDPALSDDTSAASTTNINLPGNNIL